MTGSQFLILAGGRTGKYSKLTTGAWQEINNKPW